MRIMVSACLAGENCKYNGGNNRNDRVLKLMAGNEVISVCPEQMGGLPTPRVSSEICDGIVMSKKTLTGNSGLELPGALRSPGPENRISLSCSQEVQAAG